MKHCTNLKLRELLKRTAVLIIAISIILPTFVFSSINKVGAYDYIAYGMDVSKWQGEINWDNVKASGIDFVIMRVGTSYGKDVNFEYNYLGAKSRGINVGIYYYSYALTESEARAEAETVSTWLNGKSFEYPLFYDIEDSSQLELTNDERTALCVAYNTVLENKGYLTGVYANKNWLSNYLDWPLLAEKYVIWEAAWRVSGQPEVDKSGECQLWQYTDQGSVNGVWGNVDLDVSYVNYPEIIKRDGKNGFAPGSTGSSVGAYYKTTENVNLRTGDGTSYDKLLTIPKGSTVLLHTVNLWGTWAKVTYNGTTGWLKDEYLDFSSCTPFKYTVNYVSDKEGTTAPASAEYKYGEPITVGSIEALSLYSLTGWYVKRTSDGAWKSADGWSESESDRAAVNAGATVYVNDSFIASGAGDDSYEFTAIWERSFKYGDANRDGSINARDTALMKKLVTNALGDIVVEFEIMDLNGDGKINAKDTALLNKYARGLINIFPVEQK